MKRYAARLALLGIALIFAVGSPAWAHDDDEDDELDPVREGLYLATSIGIGFDNFEGQPALSASVDWDATLGYRISEYLSVEVEFDYLEGFDDKPAHFDEINIWATTLNFRVHIPLGRIEPFILYGAGAMGVRGEGNGGNIAAFSNTDFVIKAGGGVEYHVNDNVSVYSVAVYAFPISSVADFDHASVSAGVLYKF